MDNVYLALLTTSYFQKFLFEYFFLSQDYELISLSCTLKVFLLSSDGPGHQIGLQLSVIDP